MRGSRYRTKFDVFAQVALFALAAHVVVKFTAFTYLQGRRLAEDHDSKVTHGENQT